MQQMETNVRSIEMDGLVWGACKYYGTFLCFELHLVMHHARIILAFGFGCDLLLVSKNQHDYLVNLAFIWLLLSNSASRF